jgi:4-hydroxyphenylpyruvate dioxygenase
MRTGIATLSVRGRLLDKLPVIAAAGFDGVEVFDNDLVACPAPPSEVGSRCADLGLTVDLFQPLRDAAGVLPDRFPETLRRVNAKLDVAVELGAPVVLACSHVGDDAMDDTDLLAEQLHAIGAAARDRGLRVAYEALAWGRHVNRVGQAWEAVRRADHPAVTLAVDTFHMLARGDDGAALAGVPGERIGFLQVADGPLLDMNVLEWSRHFRCFPGQGVLDVTGVVAATLEAGYRGPVSLEVFSDVVREADPAVTARDGLRSLVFLEDELAARLSGPALGTVSAAPPVAARTDLAFVELANPEGSVAPRELLASLGFVQAGRHRTKPATLWRNGGAHVVLNETPGVSGGHALGVSTPQVSDVAARAKALLWPAVDRSRGDGEALLPGITSPAGVHVFVSAAPGERDDWHGDFLRHEAGEGDGWSGVDHVGVAVPPDRLDEEIGFLRTLLDLRPAPVEEFWEPQGRLRSRALRPRSGAARVVVNVEDVRSRRPRVGVNQVAFACDDLLAKVRRLRARGVALMPVPDNYYTDLAARFDLPDRVLDQLREHGVLYDRIGEGELLHVYTDVLPTGFYVELLERRGGYDGYGSANTHVRLAAQHGWPVSGDDAAAR